MQYCFVGTGGGLKLGRWLVSSRAAGNLSLKEKWGMLSSRFIYS